MIQLPLNSIYPATKLILLLLMLLGPVHTAIAGSAPLQQQPFESMEPAQVVALANAGDVGAMMAIAHELLVARDNSGFEWVERAAGTSAQGSAYAGSFWLEGLYLPGGRELVAPNLPLAEQLLRRAADAGIEESMNALANFYNRYGSNDRPAPHMAYQWYQRAQALGNQFADFNVKLMDANRVRMGRFLFIAPPDFKQVAADNGKVRFVKQSFGEQDSIEAWSESITSRPPLKRQQATKLLSKQAKRWRKRYSRKLQRQERLAPPLGAIVAGDLHRDLIYVYQGEHNKLMHWLQLDETDGLLHHVVVRSDITIYGAGTHMDYLMASMRSQR